MKVLVIGAAGKTGSSVVQQALAAGHQVTAFVHNAEKYDAPSGVEVFGGDVQNPTKVAKALQGQDAVIDTLGGKTPYKETNLETTAARIIIDKMREAGVRRLIVVSALGEGDSVENTGFFYEHLLMPTFLRGVVKDKAGMEQAVQASGLDWTILRPGILQDGDPTGKVHALPSHSDEKVGSIHRGDVAAFAVTQLTSNAHMRQAVTLTTST